MAKTAINVLMIEDLQMAQLVATKIFDTLNCNFHVVSTASKALEQILIFHYDIIFIDIQLPDINGFSLAQTMRSLERRGTRTPFIAVTANQSEELPASSREAGFDDFILKPLNVELVRHVIQKHLSTKKLHLTNLGGSMKLINKTDKGSQDERRHEGDHKHNKR